MKLTRRNFLKSGPITAIALAIGLKPKEPKVPFADFEYYMPTEGCIHYPEPVRHTPRQLAYIRDVWLEMQFLRGDPNFRAIGILGPPNE